MFDLSTCWLNRARLNKSLRLTPELRWWHSTCRMFIPTGVPKFTATLHEKGADSLNNLISNLEHVKSRIDKPFCLCSMVVSSFEVCQRTVTLSAFKFLAQIAGAIIHFVRCFLQICSSDAHKRQMYATVLPLRSCSRSKLSTDKSFVDHDFRHPSDLRLFEEVQA